MKNLKILGIVNKNIVKGFTRICELCPSFNFDITNDKKISSSLASEYDLFISVYRVNLPKEVRKKTILFSLGGNVRRLLSDNRYLRAYKKYNFAAHWTNCRTNSRFLWYVGICADVMYRPNKIDIKPFEYNVINEPTVLVYYAKNNSSCQGMYLEKIANTIKSLSEFCNVIVFPNFHESFRCDNVKRIGKIKNWNEILPKINGMVRVTRLGDFGRCTYDIASYGKWNIYLSACEHPLCVQVDYEFIPHVVKRLIDFDTESNCYYRWKYVKENFNEDTLSEKWAKAIYGVYERTL